VIAARFEFKERDYLVSVPEQFVFDARTMLAEGSISYEGLERLVQQFEYVQSPNFAPGFEGIVIVSDRVIVYAGATLADALDWISENHVAEPALIWEIPGAEERASLPSGTPASYATPLVRLQ
jgi:hypothetical protein